MSALATTRMRLERLADERDDKRKLIEDLLSGAESEERDLNELEQEYLQKHRTRLEELEIEIAVLAEDVERANNARDVSKLVRVVNEPQQQVVETSNGGPIVYRTFAAYARDQIITRYPLVAAAVDGPDRAMAMQEQARERLSRVEHTLTSDVPGLLPPQHMAQIMDIINRDRPVVNSARRVDLSRGKLTYPKIVQRPEVLKQGTEKTEAGTANMQIDLDDITAETYLGGGNLSWQTINWSTPDALQLWFDLAAEAYANQTETAACAELEAAAGGTASPSLGTAGTEDFAAWSKSVIGGIASIYNTTGGKARTNTLYVSAARFFQAAGLGTDAVTQLATVGTLDIASMTGNFRGLRIVGSYGFSNANTAIVGDSQALLVGETPGAPVEMRAVEPAIGGMEVGVIGAFKAQVFDADRFIHLT